MYFRVGAVDGKQRSRASRARNDDHRTGTSGKAVRPIDDTSRNVARNGESGAGGAVESKLLASLIGVFLRLQDQIDFLLKQQIQQVLVCAGCTVDNEAILVHRHDHPADVGRSCPVDHLRHPVVVSAPLPVVVPREYGAGGHDDEARERSG